MSIRASNWAWGQGLPPSQKVLLLALADQADDDGVCWPSMKTLAKKICADVRTAQRNMRELEAARLVSVEARCRPDGDSTSNIYRLALTPGPPGKMPPPNDPRQNATTPVAQRPAGVVTSASPQEPSSRTVSKAAASRARDPARAAANGHEHDEPARARSTRLRRTSGIVCWIDLVRDLDDRPEAERIEAAATAEEIRVAVADVEATSKSPVPGLVWAAIMRRRVALEIATRVKTREAAGPLAEAKRRQAERERREADPAARQAGLDAVRKAAAELGFEGPDVGLIG